MMNSEGYVRKWLWPTSEHSLGICLGIQGNHDKPEESRSENRSGEPPNTKYECETMSAQFVCVLRGNCAIAVRSQYGIIHGRDSNQVHSECESAS